MKSTSLISGFEYMLSRVGGEEHPEVAWYLHKRPRTITRDSFFEYSTWAIQVSGRGGRAANTFMQRAEEAGFSWDYLRLAAWTQARFSSFVKRLHGYDSRGHARPIPPLAQKKWEAIREIARELYGHRDEGSFREEYFQGKTESAELDKRDIQRLATSGFPFIKEANAAFIIRNMGGEAIKPDRWVLEFCECSGTPLRELESALADTKILLGFFDIVLWAYCEEFVRRVDQLEQDFQLWDAFGLDLQAST